MSAPGENWTLETNSASWGTRSSHAVAVLQNTLFLSGGAQTNDVWSSTDGTNWSLVKANNNDGWISRQAHQMVSHDGRLYVIGGTRTDAFDLIGDVWSSPDGKNWTLEIDNPPFGKRLYHQVVAHNQRLYLMGGEKGDFSYNAQEMRDVWSSADGKNWRQETNSMGGGTRSLFGAISYNGRLYIMGGLNNHSVWSSVDGVAWQRETTSPNWSSRDNIALSILPAK